MCVNYHIIQCDVVNLRKRMGEIYETLLEYQKRWLDDYIEKMESRLQLLMRRPVLFPPQFVQTKRSSVNEERIRGDGSKI